MNEKKEEENSEKFRIARFNKTKKEFFKKEEKIRKIKRKIKNSIIIFVFLLFFSTIFAIINLNNNKIISGVTINGVNVSNLTKSEVKNKIENVYKLKENSNINLSLESYTEKVNLSTLEVKYELNQAIEEAYSIGRKENIFISNYEIIRGFFESKDVKVKSNFDETLAMQMIDNTNMMIPNVMVESSYSVEDDKLIINKGKKGMVIDKEKMIKIIEQEIQNPYKEEINITIPVIEKEPTKLDIDKIYEEIYKEPKDAYFQKDPYIIYPEVIGVDFNKEEAMKKIEESKEECIIDLKITVPKITINDIGGEAFSEEISKYTTRFDVTNEKRTNNLILASNKINNKVILPGEEFSFNKIVGKRTISEGYQTAKVYQSGKVVDGIGGGICQISSTLYNAVLDANLEIIERRNHQFITSYVPAGRDATVVYGVTDFKFKNTRKYPIKISSKVENGIVEIIIYGIKEEKEYEFKYTSKVIDSIPAPIRYINDDTIEQGKEIIENQGVNGLKVETYSTKILNGKVISTTLLSRDTYNPMEKVIRKGTKK